MKRDLQILFALVIAALVAYAVSFWVDATSEPVKAATRYFLLTPNAVPGVGNITSVSLEPFTTTHEKTEGGVAYSEFSVSVKGDAGDTDIHLEMKKLAAGWIVSSLVMSAAGASPAHK